MARHNATNHTIHLLSNPLTLVCTLFWWLCSVMFGIRRCVFSCNVIAALHIHFVFMCRYVFCYHVRKGLTAVASSCLQRTPGGCAILRCRIGDGSNEKCQCDAPRGVHRSASRYHVHYGSNWTVDRPLRVVKHRQFPASAEHGGGRRLCPSVDPRLCPTPRRHHLQQLVTLTSLHKLFQIIQNAECIHFIL